MTAFFLLLLLMAAPPPASLEQVKADANPEHRARLAIDFATAEERVAEAAFAKSDDTGTTQALRNVAESMEIARDSLTASRKTPGRNPGPYKYGEVHSRELLLRLRDFEQRMDGSERAIIVEVKEKVQAIHDEWFEGIMGKAR